jgi:predicted transcriptional regulator
VINVSLDEKEMMMAVANNDALMETMRIASNPQLVAKITAGMEAAAHGEVHQHQLIDDTERR